MRFTMYLFILISSLSSFYILISEVKSGIKEEEAQTFWPSFYFVESLTTFVLCGNMASQEKK